MKCDHLARTVVVEKTAGHVTVDLVTVGHVTVDLATVDLVTVDLVTGDLVMADLVTGDLVTGDLVTVDLVMADLVMADHHEMVLDEATDLQAEDQMVDRWGRQILSGWLNTPCTSTLTETANSINQK